MKLYVILLSLILIGTSCNNSDSKEQSFNDIKQKLEVKKLDKNDSINIKELLAENNLHPLIREISFENDLNDAFIEKTGMLSTMVTSSKAYLKIPDAPLASNCQTFNSIERSQLRSVTDLYYTSVSKGDKNKMGLFKLVNGDFTKNSKAFVLDYCNSLDTFCTDGTKQQKIKLVAGLRIIYFVKNWGLTIGIDGLEKIAASKELNFSESSLHVNLIGWGQGDDAVDSMKNIIQNINVKNYPQAESALVGLLTAYKKATSLKPQVIPIE